MRIIEIKPLENGGHRNQGWNGGAIPEGWAKIPDGMKTDNFPFGDVAVKEINGVMTVTKWIPGTIPETPKAEAPITAEERLAALESAMLEMALGGAE